MGKKLKFAVADLAIEERNLSQTQFALLRADVFASGMNAHNMPVSDLTLRKSAKSIYNTPLLWAYDYSLDDAGSHDSWEVPCGFVPEWSELEFNSLEDGRVMLSTHFLVWKKYSGKLIDIFKRDGDKSVSVEMEVFDTNVGADGTEEILEFEFTGTTVLGSFVTPAIPGAKANFVEFAKKERDGFEQALREFAKYGGIDFKIPDDVKANASRGLELHSEFGLGKPFNLSVARFIGKNETMPYSRVVSIMKSARSLSKNIDKDTPEDNVHFINLMLLGGVPGMKWTESLDARMKEEDDKRMSYFEEEAMPYKSLKDINPALKGIKPAITLAQANAIAKQADAIGSDEEKNGWAIAIANFKKTHVVKDGKWVKKEATQKNNSADGAVEKGETNNMENEEEKKPEAEMSAEEPKEEEMAKSEEEAKEEEMAAGGDAEEEEEKEEEAEEEGEKAEMSNQDYVDVVALEAFLDKETEAFKAIAEEMAKPMEERSYAAVAGNLFACMKGMAEDKDAYMKKCAELEKYKSEKEEKERDFEIEKVLASVSEDLPKEEISAAREAGKQFSLETLEGWKNEVRAKAFEFSKRKKEAPEELSVKIIGLPFADTSTQNSLWK